MCAHANWSQVLPCGTEECKTGVTEDGKIFSFGFNQTKAASGICSPLSLFSSLKPHRTLPAPSFGFFNVLSHIWSRNFYWELCTESTPVPDLLPSHMYSSLTRETKPRRKFKDNALNIIELLPCMPASHVMYFTQPVPTHDFCTDVVCTAGSGGG